MERRWRPRLARTKESLDYWTEISEEKMVEPSRTLPSLVRFCSGINPVEKSTRSPEPYLPYHTALYMLARYFKPKWIVETGVERGASTYVLLKAIERNQRGKLYSIDVLSNFYHTRFPIATIVPEEMRKYWVFIKGDSKEVLPKLFQQFEKEKVGMFIAGSDHSYENQMNEIRLGWGNLEGGGVLVVDRPDYGGYKALNSLLLESDYSDLVIMKESNDSLPYDFAIVVK